MEKKRILFLDIVRIVACLCILIIHFNAQVSGWGQFGRFAYPNHLIPNFYFDVYLGEIGVGLFFIISGAGLYYGHSFTELSREKIALFYKKRAKAIYPYYWIAYIFASFASFLWYKGMSMANKASIITSILGIDGYLGMLFQKYGGFYQVGEWFLGCILILYLIYPFLSYGLNIFPKMTCLAVIIVYLLCIDRFQYHWFFFQLPYLVLGFYFAKYFRTALSWKLWLPTLIAIGYRVLYNENVAYYTKSIIMCWILFLTIVLVYELLNFKFNLESNRVLSERVKYIGILTYPAFLIHHKFISMLAPTFNLQNFPYRNTIMLFVIYIYI